MSTAGAAIAEREASLGTLQGVFGRPFVALDDLVDLSGLDEIHDEVCLALAQMPTSYTGGSHRAMGIMPRACEGEALVDDGLTAVDDLALPLARPGEAVRQLRGRGGRLLERATEVLGGDRGTGYVDHGDSEPEVAAARRQPRLVVRFHRLRHVLGDLIDEGHLESLDHR